MDTVGLVSAKAAERAIITLEQAFLTDPMFTWLFPDPRRRALSLRWMNRVPAMSRRPRGTIDTRLLRSIGERLQADVG